MSNSFTLESLFGFLQVKDSDGNRRLILKSTDSEILSVKDLAYNIWKIVQFMSFSEDVSEKNIWTFLEEGEGISSDTKICIRNGRSMRFIDEWRFHLDKAKKPRYFEQEEEDTKIPNDVEDPCFLTKEEQDFIDESIEETQYEQFLLDCEKEAFFALSSNDPKYIFIDDFVGDEHNVRVSPRESPKNEMYIHMGTRNIPEAKIPSKTSSFNPIVKDPGANTEHVPSLVNMQQQLDKLTKQISNIGHFGNCSNHGPVEDYSSLLRMQQQLDNLTVMISNIGHFGNYSNHVPIEDSYAGATKTRDTMPQETVPRATMPRATMPRATMPRREKPKQVPWIEAQSLPCSSCEKAIGIETVTKLAQTISQKHNIPVDNVMVWTLNKDGVNKYICHLCYVAGN